jgi:hypothetical protein
MKEKVRTKVDRIAEKSLSENDIRVLLLLCAKLLRFCAHVTNTIDPTASAMLHYVGDDILSESKLKLPS